MEITIFFKIHLCSLTSSHTVKKQSVGSSDVADGGVPFTFTAYPMPLQS
jgi:hypothetical protein